MGQDLGMFYIFLHLSQWDWATIAHSNNFNQTPCVGFLFFWLTSTPLSALPAAAHRAPYTPILVSGWASGRHQPQASCSISSLLQSAHSWALWSTVADKGEDDAIGLHPQTLPRQKPVVPARGICQELPEGTWGWAQCREPHQKCWLSVPVCLHWEIGHSCSNSKLDEAQKREGISIHRKRHVLSFADLQCFRRERRVRYVFFFLEALFLFYPRSHAPLLHVHDFQAGMRTQQQALHFRRPTLGTRQALISAYRVAERVSTCSHFLQSAQRLEGSTVAFSLTVISTWHHETQWGLFQDLWEGAPCCSSVASRRGSQAGVGCQVPSLREAPGHGAPGQAEPSPPDVSNGICVSSSEPSSSWAI